MILKTCYEDEWGNNIPSDLLKKLLWWITGFVVKLDVEWEPVGSR